jgi:hypothetical protein
MLIVDTHPSDPDAKALARREFAIGFAASISYFVALLVLPAIFLFNALILLVLAYFAGGAIVAALVVGAPLGMAGQAVVRRFPRTSVALATFFAVGALTAYLGFGIFTLLAHGQFAPFVAFGADSPFAVGILIVIAGFCALGGWMTAMKNTTPTSYDDALDGLDFGELAELIRTARDDK